MGGLLDSEPSERTTLEEQFNRVLPYYISIGMPVNEFWHEDVDLVKAYRKAWEYKQEQWNTQAYLNGVYTYQAILRASPVLHAFAKRGTKPMPYLDKPLETAEQHKQREKDKGKIMQEKITARFERFNKYFRKNKKQEEAVNGRDRQLINTDKE